MEDRHFARAGSAEKGRENECRSWSLSKWGGLSRPTCRSFEGEKVYITLSREKPVDLMSENEIQEIIMSFDSVDSINDWGTRDPKSWDKLWRRTLTEAAAEILRRRAQMIRATTDRSMVS